MSEDKLSVHDSINVQIVKSEKPQFSLGKYSSVSKRSEHEEPRKARDGAECILKRRGSVNFFFTENEDVNDEEQVIQ